MKKILGGCLVFIFIFIFIFLVNFQPAAAENKKMVEIVLDASGSMNGRLSNGQTKIDAAKEAVTRLAESLPDSLVLAFRAYGHQSPRQKKDCQDTQLLTEFGALSQVKGQIVSQVKGLQAQGYTPITYVLGLAALDFPSEEDIENIIILVSDGKETCQGDPCVAAKNLKEKNVRLAVHTIGFGVDEATKDQLDCISRATGGTYFGAESMDELIRVLTEAVSTEIEIPVESQGPGWLRVEGADQRGHVVTDAETGQEVGRLSNVRSTIELPAGIYNITVGSATWKSVEVKAGETTVLRPGWLDIRHASFRGHQVLDAETGEEHAELSNLASTAALMPGSYLVMFGELPWPVTIEAGKTTSLNPGVVSVKRASYLGHIIRTKGGKEVGAVSNTASSMPLPPGEYTIEIQGKVIPFSLAEGQEVAFELK